MIWILRFETVSMKQSFYPVRAGTTRVKGPWYEKTEDDRYLQPVSVFLYQVSKLLQQRGLSDSPQEKGGKKYCFQGPRFVRSGGGRPLALGAQIFPA